ncbi:MAG: hypothetical protein KC910_37330 [Candidatus Eremiobacteraeota bacterium]|nr:hypothetical protein [Candidatus Eremiobacteraeota bacterium]
MTELPNARIAADGVYLDGEKLPGLIAAQGITVRPDVAGIYSSMTVEFLVGMVYIEPPE